jgi:Ca2+-binding RTX toxin-like protein
LALFKFLPIDPDSIPPAGGSILVLATLPFSLDDFRVGPGFVTLLSDASDPANKLSMSFKGSGFVTVFDGTDVTVNKGTITSILARNMDGDIILDATGLNLNAKTLFDLIDAGSALDLANFIMGTNDRVEGSAFGDQIGGLAGRDTILGFGGADVIQGFEGRDSILGGAQGDLLQGDDGRDTLFGGKGSDELVGGRGNDQLTGGIGADEFQFDEPFGASNVDQIIDFKPGVDTITLDLDIFTALGGVGALSAAEFRVGAGAGDGSDRIIYNKATGVISYDANGVVVGAPIAFAKVTPGLTLTFADFEVIG